MTAVADDIAVFDDLYRRSPDPWGTATHWYERRKRAILLAALSDDRYEAVYEAGCGTGHITRELATRATRLLASDAAASAVAITRDAVRGCDNVTVERHLLPDDWPHGSFDLVVLSEMLYFVDDEACARIAREARTSVAASGTVVACNWRHAIEGRHHRGDEVHRRFETALGLPRLFEYADADFILSGWRADTTSVAMRDALR